MAIKISGVNIVDDSQNLRITGVSTFSGIATHTTSLFGTQASFSGVVSATSFSGSLSGTASTASFATTSFGLSGTPNVTVGVLTASTISAGGTTGTSGQLLQSTGTGVTWTAAPSGGISVTDSNLIGYNSAGIRSDSANGRLEVFGTGNFQVFTAPGTYTASPGISSIRVRVVGAGGNGGPGAYAPTPTSPGGGGSGGGGGGYAHKVIPSASFPAPRAYSVTVGTAPGGTSSFGAVVSATGGGNGSNSPGPTSAPGGTGGSGSGGDVNYTGATGTASPGNGVNNGYKGGAAATQLGNGSGNSVPGLPSANSSYNVFIPSTSVPSNSYVVSTTLRDTSVARFPFDIFNGVASSDSGGYYFPGPSSALNGINGGAGGTAQGNPSLTNPAGGNGGWGGGGGGGSYGAGPSSSVSGSSGGNGGIGGGGGGGGVPGATGPSIPGGSGGNGIVIVEW